jgi:hypothetical protein
MNLAASETLPVADVQVDAEQRELQIALIVLDF